MDLNQGSAEKSNEASPQSQLAVQAPKLPFGGKKFYIPKFQMPNLREKFAEYGRILKVTKKPDSAEFKAIVKASGLGIAIIGIVGFIVAIIVQLTGFG